MPKRLERKIRASGRRRGLSGRRLDRYTYGAMRRRGWRPGRRR